MTADQTPGDGARCGIPIGWECQLATLRQSLTEAEASHQAEIERLRAELDEARKWAGDWQETARIFDLDVVHWRGRAETVEAERDTLTARLAAVRSFVELLESEEGDNQSDDPFVHGRAFEASHLAAEFRRRIDDPDGPAPELVEQVASLTARLAQADAVIARMDALIRSGCLAGCGSNGQVVAAAVRGYLGEKP